MVVGEEFFDKSRFRLIELLGHGTLGRVYRAHDGTMRKEVALKMLPELAADRILFIKEEFRLLSGIRHRNLVELYELNVDERHCFFTMELIEGGTFTEYVRAPGMTARRGGLSDAGIARLRDAIGQLAEGIAVLHAHCKLHRDIKPLNVLVTHGGRVVLLDFDMVMRLRPEGAQHDDSRSFAGSPGYTSPEQYWSAPLSVATDWYSAGVLIFEALTGRLPFDDNELVPIPRRDVIPDLVALAPDTPSDLVELVRGLLESDPARRAGEILVRRVARAAAPRAQGVPPFAHLDAEAIFVGRADELSQLHAAFEDACGGKPVVVQIEGASGIGKSQLVRRFLRSLKVEAARAASGHTPAGARELIILRGTCYPHESVPCRALDNLVDELSRLLFQLAPLHREALVPPHAGALIRLFPVLAAIRELAAAAAPESEVEPQELRQRGFRALRELFERIASSHPLVLWIDDLQWGDADSAPFFRELLRPPSATPLLLLLSYRSEDRAQNPLLATLEHNQSLPDGCVRRVELGPLGLEDSRALAEKLIAGAPARSAALATSIAAASAGSPFFVVALAQYAKEEPEDEQSQLPSTDRLELLLRHRLARLLDRERRILEIVAVAGRTLDCSLALKAAQLGEDGRIEVKRLSQAHLLRYSEVGDGRAIESYHDRVRQAALASMSEEQQRQRHLDLAEVFRAEPTPDAEVLFEHYRQGGERGLAGCYAELAAERAFNALAFDRAARLYQHAIELGITSTPLWKLLERRGEALANAGLSHEAGKSFEDAAAAFSRTAADAGLDAGSQALDLERRAAEHYLRSGSFALGIRTLRRVLHAVGIDYPASPWRACVAMLLSRARLELRGLSYRKRRAADIPAAELERIDACWSAGLGLAWVDRMRTGAFQVRYTQMALDAGEPTHIARALAVEASQLASYGGAARHRRSAAVIAEAKRLAETTGDLSASAFTTLMEGSIAFYDGRWKQAVVVCSSAQEFLRERCRATSWEMTTGNLFSFTSLFYLGALEELRASLPALHAEALDRGDRLGAASLASGLPNAAWLVSDQPEEARQRANAALALWKQDDFQFQHYLHLIATTQIDLYEGDGEAAWERITAAWPRLRSSFLLIVQNLRITLIHLRARAALAAAARTRSVRGTFGHLRRARDRARLLAVAERDATRLGREDALWAAPLAAVVKAEVDAALGEAGTAISSLERAARLFEALDMPVYAAAAQRRRAVLLGGDEGTRLRAESEREMEGQGVDRPDLIAAMLCPAATE